MEQFSKLLVEFYERLSSWEQSVVRDSGLTLQQMHTIEVLGNSGSLRMKDLANKLGVVMGTLTVMINRLEQMGLVAREQSLRDKRSFEIDLTAKGRERYREHHNHHLLLAGHIHSCLSDDQKRQFNGLLQLVLENL